MEKHGSFQRNVKDLTKIVEMPIINSNAQGDIMLAAAGPLYHASSILHNLNTRRPFAIGNW